MNVYVLSKQLYAAIFVGKVLLINVNIPKAKADRIDDDAAVCMRAVQQSRQLSPQVNQYCRLVIQAKIKRDNSNNSLDIYKNSINHQVHDAGKLVVPVPGG